MDLPVKPPVNPMLAKAVDGISDRDDLIFEPKWDGFRCIVFRDGDELELGSAITPSGFVGASRRRPSRRQCLLNMVLADAESGPISANKGGTRWRQDQFEGPCTVVGGWERRGSWPRRGWN